MKLRFSLPLLGVGLVVLHLALVAWNAASLPGLPGVLGRVVAYYGLLSGAGSSYGFFAPKVGTHLRASLIASTGSGAVPERRIFLDEGFDREGQIRFGNIVGGFWEDVHDRKRQRALTASWAGKAFARYPEATRVTVAIEKYYLPSMRRYGEGRTPQWKPYYDASFERRKSKATR